uniref:LITAF domain-containing protein n=1 Tax=Helicotheca tamesis TaxID=374047 RepID=A0A7S2IAS7_9STRA|mmetsp:Transcript_7451/g.10116  ORF Transcript_7451/g.10116 Transcript_7451/m.10116 type:complete len:134 (+) Transcript_7451:75-476(+)
MYQKVNHLNVKEEIPVEPEVVAIPVPVPEQPLPTENEETAARHNFRHNFFGRVPLFVDRCPKCQQENVKTTTKTYPTWKTLLSVGILVIIFWPVCWIPLVLHSTRKTDHHCTNCGERIGEVEPFEDSCVDIQT